MGNDMTPSKLSPDVPRPRDSAAGVAVCSSLFRHCEPALSLLSRAQQYALNLDRSSWDFAVEISELRKLGLSNSDLRCLVCAGLVSHGRETTRFNELIREFRADGGLRFTRKTCFVLTESGVRYASRSGCDREPPRKLNGSQMEDGQQTTSKCVKPEWDKRLLELRVGDALVKRFRVPAPNQEIVLAVFQEEGRPVHIAHPTHAPTRNRPHTPTTRHHQFFKPQPKGIPASVSGQRVGEGCSVGVRGLVAIQMWPASSDAATWTTAAIVLTLFVFTFAASLFRVPRRVPSGVATGG